MRIRGSYTKRTYELDNNLDLLRAQERNTADYINKDMALRELSKVLKDFGIKNTNDFYYVSNSFR